MRKLVHYLIKQRGSVFSGQLVLSSFCSLLRRGAVALVLLPNAVSLPGKPSICVFHVQPKSRARHQGPQRRIEQCAEFLPGRRVEGRRRFIEDFKQG
ncbi:hypothetical protein B9Z19DRAFT_1073477, partial [Tuber borchii]